MPACEILTESIQILENLPIENNDGRVSDTDENTKLLSCRITKGIHLSVITINKLY